MASRLQQQVIKRFGPKIKEIEFTFFPQGSSTTPLTRANGFLKTDGGVANVTRTGTAGTFLVTLDNSYRDVIGHQGTVRLNAAADLKVAFGAFSNLGTSSPVTFTVYLLAVATPTDLAANTNNAVSCLIRFSDSSARS